MTPRPTRWKTLTPLVVAMSMTLAACGTASGADDPEGVASLDDDSATTTTAAEDPEAPTDPEEAFSQFEECMAEHGIDISEGAVRTSDGGIAIAKGGDDGAESSDSSENEDGVLDVDPEEFRAADNECRKHLANVDNGFELTPEQEAAMEDASLKFEECMQEHGLEGGFHIAAGSGEGASSSSDVQDDPEPDPQAQSEIDPEELDAAHEECMKIYQETPELEGLFDDAPEVAGRLGGSGE